MLSASAVLPSVGAMCGHTAWRSRSRRPPPSISIASYSSAGTLCNAALIITIT